MKAMADETLEATRSTAPVEEANATPEGADDDEEMPQVVFTRRSVLVFALFVISAVAFLYFVLPRIGGLDDTWARIRNGNAVWLVAACLLEICSYLAYMVLFRTVCVREDSPIGLWESYLITMAGVAATRLFATAGAGGIAVTAWALRRSGMERRLVACRMVAFMVILYGVFMATLVIGGLGLNSGLLPGGTSFAFTTVPALFGGAVILVFGAMSMLPSDFERRLREWSRGRGRFAHLAGRLATAPASIASGVRTALRLTRERDPGLLGAIGWWYFDIATLWACFHAFGLAPPFAVVVMAYFIGQLGNVLPLPGGVGGVEGAMVGAFVGFGVEAGLALVAVLTYRAFAFWLPTIPGAVAYLQLRKTVQRWKLERVAA